MRGKLRSKILALALISCLALAPWALAQGPATMPTMTSDGEAAGFAGFFSWWHAIWSDWFLDSTAPTTDFAKSDSEFESFEDKDTDLDPRVSGNEPENLPNGDDGDNNAGLDPNGSP